MVSMNKLGIIQNPHQGTYKRVLCVCSSGILRSPTAAIVLWKEYGYNTRAAGIDEEFSLIYVNEALAMWADEVVFMQEGHRNGYEAKYLGARLFDQQKHYVLGIEDDYEYMSQDLQKLISDRYARAEAV